MAVVASAWLFSSTLVFAKYSAVCMPWRITPISHNWVNDEYEVHLVSFKSEVRENVKEF
jgi:hypothetical protein